MVRRALDRWDFKPEGRRTIVHVIHSLEGGGTERMLVSLLNALPAEEFRHVVVTLREAGELAARLPDHVGCRPLGIQGRMRRSGVRLAGVLRSLNASVVHARNTGCWGDTVVAGILNPGVRVVLGFHGLEHEGGFPRRTRWLARAAGAIGGIFTSVSARGREKLVSECDVPSSQVTVIRNGVDLSRFAPTNTEERHRSRKRLGFGDEDIVFGTVGKLVPVKRHDLLIEAFVRVSAAFPAARLLIVGDGPCRAGIEQQLHRLSLDERIILGGRRADVANMLWALDGYVCSSDAEGVSNAMLEAMAAGLPVVTTDVGDHAAIVRNGREGLVVAAGSARDMAQAMERMIKDHGHRHNMGVAARTRASEFSVAGCAESYFRFYGELLSASGGPARSERGTDRGDLSVRGFQDSLRPANQGLSRSTLKVG